jgi:hypothetical protein
MTTALFENLCFISYQVVKARINKGFLEAMDGHCQWNCQQRGGCNCNPPPFGRTPLKLARYTLTCRDGSGA